MWYKIERVAYNQEINVKNGINDVVDVCFRGKQDKLNLSV